MSERSYDTEYIQFAFYHQVVVEPTYLIFTSVLAFVLMRIFTNIEIVRNLKASKLQIIPARKGIISFG